MDHINQHNEQQQQQVFTRAEVESPFREFERTRIREQERQQGLELPLAILQALNETSTVQLQENFKNYKRAIQRYNHEKWTRAEQINKEFISDLKNWKVDAH
jgi:ribosome-binding ATPase YchF (GTP1/OBG family)